MPGINVDFLNSLSPNALKLLARIPVENPNPILIIGFDGILNYANNAFLSLADFSHFKIGGAITGPLQLALEEAVKSGKTIEKELACGEQFFIFTITPVPDTNCSFIYGRDITGLKIQELNLRQMALIAEETYNSVVITDPEGRIVWVNKSFTRLTGYGPDEVIGKIPGEFLQGPETDPATVKRLADALVRQESIEAEIVNYSKDGNRYWVNLQIQPIFNSKGILENYISIQKDITTEHLLREEIAESELELRTILNSALDGVIIIDDQSLVKAWTPRCVEIFGYLPEEVLEKPIGPLIVPERMREAHLTGMRRYISTGIPKILNQRIEITGIRKNGEEFPVELTVVPVRRKQKTLFCAFVRDISYPKGNEEKLISTTSRLTALISNLKSGVLVEDENRCIALTNKEFCRLFEIPAAPDQLLGFDCNLSAQQSKEMFADPEGFIQKIDQILANQEIVLDEELLLADGRIFERDYIPIISGGTFLGNLWQYRDITPRKKNQARLEHAMKEAERANLAKSNFLANMSHEIRTPLNAVYGIIRLLSDAPHLPEQEDLHNRLLTSSENLLTIINDILDFSKIEAGLLTLEKNPFNLSDLIGQIAASYGLKASEKSIELRYYIDKTISKYLIGDKVRIGQVLANLVSNAIKFTEKGYIEINCKLLAEEGGSDRIYFSIRDTGIGIDDSRLDKIFESYQQEDISTTRQYGGTGLGLSISRQLVEMMGGNLKVISTKGQGSTFYFTLKFQMGSDIEEEKHQESLIDQEKLRGIKVLVVEDNEMNQFVAKSILKKWNVEVFLAHNGKAAVDFLTSQTCDIVLMDKQMPLMNGVEATRIIRQDLGLEIPIIALTADAVIEMVEECIDAGMNDYVTKPFEPSVLFNKIAKVLGRL